MGNKQTIFTDEQLDAYQVRLASSAEPIGFKMSHFSLVDSLRK